MLRILILSLVCHAAFSKTLGPPMFMNRIVGGTQTYIEAHPYQISLQLLGHICGGSIISSDTIVTAAHCVAGTPAILLTIRAGSSSRLTGGVSIRLSSTIIHPQYDSSTIDFDIALLKLSEPLVFSSTIQPIALPEDYEEPDVGADAVVTGWGVTSEGGILPPIYLREVTVQITDQEVCRQAYSNYLVTDRMICAAVPGGGKDACQGDSGGPLVVDGKLVGIVSWGLGCARPDYPGVYTRVGVLRSWIREASGIRNVSGNQTRLVNCFKFSGRILRNCIRRYLQNYM